LIFILSLGWPKTLHPQIRARAREVVEKANAHTDVEMARAIYDHVVSTVKYDKSGKGAGRGDIDYVCEERRGNCVDFDAIFIGYSRATGPPNPDRVWGKTFTLLKGHTFYAEGANMKIWNATVRWGPQGPYMEMRRGVIFQQQFPSQGPIKLVAWSY
jgi:hypothetical protein